LFNKYIKYNFRG